MQNDERFAERIRRIETGRTWTPDGVVRPKEPRRRRLRFGHLFWLAVLAAAGTATLRPDLAASVLDPASLSDAASRASTLPFVGDVLQAVRED